DEVPEKYAEAIVLCDIWGFTYREIADIVDVPVVTIRSRISRGRSRLIDVLSRFESSDTSDPSSAE
ncbi:MAG: sigma factor-like helix-turn-helix DNA-binding protein, partial [Bradymonadaceae bacterium]